MPLSFEDEKKIDALIARAAAGKMTADERAQLADLHARKRASDPPPLRFLPYLSTDVADLDAAALVVALDVDEPLGLHMKTDLRLPLRNARGDRRLSSWATPEQVAEYTQAQEVVLDLWRSRGHAKMLTDEQFRTKHTHWTAITGDERWDFLAVARHARVRVVGEVRGNLLCAWWMQCIGDPYLLFRWFLTEQAKQQGNPDWSPWQPVEDRTRLATTPLAEALLDTAKMIAGRVGLVLADLEAFWAPRLPKPAPARSPEPVPPAPAEPPAKLAKRLTREQNRELRRLLGEPEGKVTR
jgi:hypothetical protein